MLLNKTGTPSSSEEVALEVAISKIEPWAGKTVSYERILSGITNVNWKIHVAEEDRLYFLKIHGQDTDMFINRRVATAANIKATTLGYGPKLVHNLRQDGVEVFEFLES